MSEDIVRKITFIIESDLNNVALIGTSIQGLCSLTPLSQSTVNNVQLSTVEWINNVIKHSYINQEGYPIEVVVNLHPNRLEIDIMDTGKGMDPLLINLTKNKEKEFDPADLSALPESGFGLIIIKNTMDEVTYQSDGRAHRLQMVKWL